MTQQVFIKAYESIGSYQLQGVPFTAWLFRIAHNQMVDFIRKESKKPTVPLDESFPIKDDSDLEGEVETKIEMEKVVLATKQLTIAQREVISLRFAAGCRLLKRRRQ